MSAVLPSVVVFTLGGTIAMAGGSAPGVTPQLGAAALVEAVPSLSEIATISMVDFRKVPGASLQIGDLVELAAQIDEALRGGAHGVVVTQGTDTIEESSYCLELLTQVPGRIIVTGAMRNPTLPGADGPANLYAAVALAAGDEDLGGVAVVLNDEVHHARSVRKQHSTLPSAFGSPGVGPLGIVVEGRFMRTRRTAEPRLTIPRDQVGSATPWVPIVPVALGDDGRLIDAVRDADAVVIEAFGGGHVPSGLAERIGDLARRVPVVMASRTGGGPVLRQTYGFAGSEIDLRERGVLSAGLLAAAKVRLVLLLALRSGADRDRVEAYLCQLDAAATVEDR